MSLKSEEWMKIPTAGSVAFGEGCVTVRTGIFSYIIAQLAEWLL